MRKLISLLAVAFILQGFLSTSQAAKLFDYQKTVLDNGLTVLTLEDFSCPIVAVQVWYQVGSKNEDPNRQGFAHMFEHMMFRGTDRLGPEEHFSIIRSVGGSCNGYTSFDRTVYLETLPAEQVEVALWLESERMAFLKITQTDFDTERKVVEEELRKKIDKPYGTVTEKIFEQIFAGTPYQWMPIGQIADLRSASVDELRAFWKKYYGPENATLIVVGAVKHKDVQELAKKYFGWIVSQPKPYQVNVTEKFPNKPVDIRIQGERAPAPVVGARWLTVAEADIKDTAALDLLSIIVGSGNSSRLYQELVDTKRVAVSADSGTFGLQKAGLFDMEAVLPQKGGDPNLVMSLLEKNIGDIRTNGVTDAELEKAKNQMLRSVITQKLEIENKAEALGLAEIDVGDINSVNSSIEDIKKVTAKKIKEVANKYLGPDQIYRIYVPQNINGPVFSKNSTQEAANVTEHKSEEVKPGRGNSVRPKDYPTSAPLVKSHISALKPKFYTEKLDNGLTVMVVPNDEIPFITVQLGIMYGGWTDEIPGTCSMAMDLLDKGTKNYTSAELAEKLESQAISLSAEGEIDTSSVSASCVTDRIDSAMELMAEVVLNPIFPAVEFDKEKEKLLTELAVKQQTPEYLADKELRLMLYGKHPYSRSSTGEVEDINKLSADICKNWWRKFSQPSQSVMIFAGDITKDKAVRLAKKNFGKWKNSSPVINPNFPMPDTNHPTQIYLVNYPGSKQSQIRFAQIGITRKMQPEYFTSRIVSDYFGFGFNSRLNKSIRVEKGLTYGVWGGYIANKLLGDFKISTFSKTASTADAVKALFEQVKLLKVTPPTEEELSQSKSYIAGSFVLNHETPQQVAGDLWLIKSQNLQDDYLDRLLSAVQTTTVKDCQNLVDKTLTPDKMIIVVVGDASVLKEQLEKIAPVKVIENL